MLFLFLSCLNTEYGVENLIPGNPEEAKEGLYTEDVSFISYCGTIVNPGAEYSSDSMRILGTVW